MVTAKGLVMSTRKFLEYLCQHLLAIAWYEGPANDDGKFNRQPDFKLGSAFLVQPVPDSDYTLLATAGHNLTGCPKNRMIARGHCLFDAWGPKAKCGLPIPFNPFEEPRSVVEEPGMGRDYGFVVLRDDIHRLLQQTTTPFPRDKWACEGVDHFKQFFMVGLPAVAARQITASCEGRNTVTTSPNPELLVLDPCEPHPKMKPSSAPQFVAKIVGRGDLTDIQGMSGGPIIGVRDLGGGRSAYSLVAIQSRWLPDKRIVVGTLLSEIASDLDAMLAQMTN
jgi:hypothetical protein